MSEDPEDRPPEYRVYKRGAATPAGRRTTGSGARPASDRTPGPRPASDRTPDPGARQPATRPYKTYRSQPRGLTARLRGETDPELEERAELGRRSRGGGGGPGGSGRGGSGGLPAGRFGRWTARRVLKYVVLAVVAWVVLSAVLFFVSAQDHVGDLPDAASAKAQLTSGGPMLTSANTILILGLDNRPTTGPGSKEGGLEPSDVSEADANTDSMMLWRIGGGVSRRLSIPRDTLVDIPGGGEQKINAAWSIGGPALTLRVVKALTGLQINHLVVVDLANFPKFIDDIGGVTVTTPRICSNISGGTALGGFTLNLSPGVHHLDGLNALILARTRENSCNPAYNDLNREAMQQEIMNGIKSQLFSAHAFLHLPWAAWDAPGVIQTDMGGLTLMQLFIASEIGGSAPTGLLSETPETLPAVGDVLVPNAANVKSAVAKFLNG